MTDADLAKIEHVMVTDYPHPYGSRLIAEIRRLRALTAWQPIATAPQFTRVIMAIIRGGEVRRVSDGIRTELAWYDWNGRYAFNPTHYMPLPSPPEKGGGE